MAFVFSTPSLCKYGLTFVPHEKSFWFFVAYFLGKIYFNILTINILKKTKNKDSPKLEYVIRAMGKVELRNFRHYLESPLFNTRNDVLLLYEWLLDKSLENKAAAYAYIYADAPFDGQKMRLLMSYLQQLAEQYLAYLQWQKTPAAPELQLLKMVRERGLATHFNESLKTTKNMLERQPLRNGDYYIWRGEALWEEARFESEQNPSAKHYLTALSENADLLWAAQKLRYFCLHHAQRNFYKDTEALPLRAEVEEILLKGNLLRAPAVATWYHCLKMLESPAATEHFNQFKQLLLAEDRLFNRDEVHDLHLFALNYCIRRVNEGQRDFNRDIMDFYKDGLQKGYLLENGVLSRFAYHNIVAAGLQTREYDWVERFIGQYKSALERIYRDSAYSFNLARLEFARKRYDVLLPLLQNANYHDPIISLAAKSMALKIYYETGEYDLLDSHLEAMKNYIRRKTTLGYHRAYYLNLVKYTQKLMYLNWLDAKEVAALNDKISEEKTLHERDWLLEMLKRK